MRKGMPERAINYEMQTSYTDLNVGVIIGAVGFKTYDPEPRHDYGYGLYDNIITAMEFERLLNAAGPTGVTLYAHRTAKSQYVWGS